MIAIAGGPRTGKTTLAKSMASDMPGECRHTDHVANMGWSLASMRVSHWFDNPDVSIVEGVAVPRALRKWLKRNPIGKPCDVLIWLSTPFVKLTPGQVTMGKGCVTVLGGILGELQGRGVRFEVKGDSGLALAQSLVGLETERCDEDDSENT